MSRLTTSSVGLWGVILLAFSVITCSSKGTSSSQEMVCTNLNCEDLFAAQVLLNSNSVPSGMHTLTVVADGVTASCTFPFPPDFSNNSGGKCSGNLSVVVQAAETCQSGAGDGAITEQCDSLPGQFTELIVLKGTPASVQVQQATGGSLILDESVMPSYLTNEPNGPGCPPTCEQATAQWTLP